MQSRRKLLLAFTACFVAMGFVVASVVADELLGVLSKVDVEGKKITVVEKDTDKEIEIKITDDTEQVSKKGNTKVDLEKLEAKVKKTQDAGKKVNVKVTHDKKVASKLEFPKGKGQKKKDN
jgi:biopolymer transport protein ExbD